MYYLSLGEVAASNSNTTITAAECGSGTAAAVFAAASGETPIEDEDDFVIDMAN